MEWNAVLSCKTYGNSREAGSENELGLQKHDEKEDEKKGFHPPKRKTRSLKFTITFLTIKHIKKSKNTDSIEDLFT